MGRAKNKYLLLLTCLFLAAGPAASQAPAPSAVTVFEGARLITGDGSAPIENAAFVVENNVFTRVGRRGEVTVPAGALAAIFDKRRLLIVVEAGATAISAALATTAMPFRTGAPSITNGRSRANSSIGRPPAGTMTSAPAATPAST